MNVTSPQAIISGTTRSPPKSRSLSAPQANRPAHAPTWAIASAAEAAASESFASVTKVNERNVSMLDCAVINTMQVNVT